MVTPVIELVPMYCVGQMRPVTSELLLTTSAYVVTGCTQDRKEAQQLIIQKH